FLAILLARRLVDVLAGAFLAQLHPPLHLEVPVRIVVVPDADADPRVRPQVAALRAPVRRVEDDVIAIRVDPDDARLRPPAVADGRHDGEVLALQESLLPVRELRHRYFTVVGMFEI